MKTRVLRILEKKSQARASGEKGSSNPKADHASMFEHSQLERMSGVVTVNTGWCG